jgi:hypothetical protein
MPDHVFNPMQHGPAPRKWKPLPPGERNKFNLERKEKQEGVPAKLTTRRRHTRQPQLLSSFSQAPPV